MEDLMFLGGGYERSSAVCSDNNCPCPQVVIPRGEGYIFVEDYGNGHFSANLTCEQGARLRNLDLNIAHLDAVRWWKTGYVPKRETPKKHGPQSLPYEKSISDEEQRAIAQKWREERIKQLNRITESLKIHDSTFTKYLFFDTETTGVPRNYDAPITDLNNWPRLVQLAWILCDENGNQLAEYNEVIKPNGFSIPIDASNVHHITTEVAYAKGVNLNDALIRFAEVAQSANVIIGHNVDFDIKIVGAELLRINSNFRITDKPSICTMLKSMNYCAIPSGRDWGDPYKWPKLQELHRKLFGHEFEDAHDAMADIQATKKCFYELVQRNVIKLNK